MLNNARQSFSNNCSHAATKKCEVENPERDDASMNRRNTTDHGFSSSSFSLRGDKAFLIRFPIHKVQRIIRLQHGIKLGKRPAINDSKQPLLNRQAQMGMTFRTDKQATFDFFTKQDLLTGSAFDPD